MWRRPLSLRSSISLFAPLVLAACGSAAAPPSFGDAGGPGGDATRPHDGTIPGVDTGFDAPGSGDTGEPGFSGDAAPETPCSNAEECASRVCGTGMDGGKSCSANGTCKCQPATCTDGVKNGTETDVDCGGGACPKCGDGHQCRAGHTDCVSGECGIGTQGQSCSPADAGSAGCTCQPPSCDDGVLNGDESDVDCGSTGMCPMGETCLTCSGCTTGKKCAAPGDCLSATCTTSTCACPTGMTEASTSLNVPYCIDAYEATYNEYTAFKNAHSITEQPAFCAWNTTYAPSANFPQLPAWSTLPVTNVNWCDAYMYCHASGKHLCGQIANNATHINEGDPIDPANANTATEDEWYNACSDQGANEYPYSASTYNDNACNGAQSLVQTQALWTTGCNSFDPSFASPVPTVGATETMDQPTTGGGCSPPVFFEATCIGGTSNVLYDMSGNVAEWENSCATSGADAGAADLCNVRGGSFKSTQPALTCKTSVSQPPLARDASADDVGIRCCL